MPSSACLRCGGGLKPVSVSERVRSRWRGLKSLNIYQCLKCRGRWLYSKDLTCPVLLRDGRV